MSDYTDEQLILKFQKGDIKSYNEIVERFKDRLLNFVNGYMNDYAMSQNLVQDTFVKVYTHGHSYKEISKFSTWIYTIAGNLAKTELRKLKRRKTYSFSQLSNDEREFSLDRHSFVTSNSSNSEERHQKYHDIREAIPQLSEDFRNINNLGLNLEVKKTDSFNIMCNDTCPDESIEYLIIFTGKKYISGMTEDIQPQIIFINGDA